MTLEVEVHQQEDKVDQRQDDKMHSRTRTSPHQPISVLEHWGATKLPQLGHVEEVEVVEEMVGAIQVQTQKV